ncbi:TRAP transporter small permease [Rhodosalinus sp. FB01]|uniref:TRAP transporter small permease n=1 Tax=Rhodosalinus sp. FB01 TaxID=3239194 RepID=UPI00352631CD
MSVLDSVIRTFVFACAIMSGVLIVGIAALGFADVIGYQFFDTGVPGALELASKGLAAAFFLALPLAQYRRSHVDVDIVANMLPEALQRLFGYIGLVAALAVFGVIGWQAVDLVTKSYQLSESAQGIIPFAVWPFKTAVLVGAIGSALIALMQILGRDAL